MASSIGKIGVRIGIPSKVFKNLFTTCDIYRGPEVDPRKAIGLSIPAVITDVAYWHFGSNPQGFNDMLFYRNYEFPLYSLGLYDETTLERRTQKAVWKRPDPRDLKPCFKQAIWRGENECRVYGDLRNLEMRTPKAVFISIKKEAFRGMEFILPPGFAYNAESGYIIGKKMWNLNDLFSQALEEGIIALSQFKALPQQETWAENNNRVK